MGPTGLVVKKGFMHIPAKLNQWMPSKQSYFAWAYKDVKKIGLLNGMNFDCDSQVMPSFGFFF